jgi:SAM-dependent MidA family methyltransferase
MTLRDFLEGRTISFKRYMELCLKEISGYHSRVELPVESFALVVEEMLALCKGSEVLDLGLSHPDFVKRIAKMLPNVNYYLLKHDYIEWKSFRQVEIVEESEVGEIEGVIVSNKLFSLLPFHVILKDEVPKLLYVSFHDGNASEVAIPPERDPDFKELMEYLLKVEDPRKRIEVCLEAVKLLKFAGKKLSRGFVLTSDYLLDPSELGDTQRSQGTITCTSETIQTHNPYLLPGKLVIRAGVNLSALVEYGEEVGLKVTGLTNPMHLTKSTAGQELEVEKLSPKYRARLGSIRMLIQHKNLKNPVLNSLRYVPRFDFWEKYNLPSEEEMEILPEG